MSYIKLIIFNFLIISVLAEFALRFIYTPPSLKNRIEMNISATNQPENENANAISNYYAIFNYSDMRFNPHSTNLMVHQEYKITTVHDAIGFRNPCYSKINWQNYNLIIGDSFVYGIGLTDPYTFGCLLAKKENSVYTMGVPGMNVPQYIEMLEKNIDRVRSQISNPNSVLFFLFLGNDFESLIKYGNEENLNLANFQISQNSFFSQHLERINTLITKTPYINQSYFITSIKLLVKSVIYSSDKGEYIINYSGSTFYKSTSVKPVFEISNSISKIKMQLLALNLKIDGFFLIEDPAMLDPHRLQRDLSVASYKKQEAIDIGFKVETIMAACQIQNVNCFDTRKILDSSSYYTHDSHLNKYGAEKLSEYVHTVTMSHELNNNLTEKP